MGDDESEDVARRFLKNLQDADKDQSGRINERQLRHLLKKVGVKPEDVQISANQLIDRSGDDLTRSISFGKFIQSVFQVDIPEAMSAQTSPSAGKAEIRCDVKEREQGKEGKQEVQQNLDLELERAETQEEVSAKKMVLKAPSREMHRTEGTVPKLDDSLAHKPDSQLPILPQSQLATGSEAIVIDESDFNQRTADAVKAADASADVDAVRRQMLENLENVPGGLQGLLAGILRRPQAAATINIETDKLKDIFKKPESLDGATKTAGATEAELRKERIRCQAQRALASAALDGTLQEQLRIAGCSGVLARAALDGTLEEQLRIAASQLASEQCEQVSKRVADDNLEPMIKGAAVLLQALAQPDKDPPSPYSPGRVEVLRAAQESAIPDVSARASRQMSKVEEATSTALANGELKIVLASYLLGLPGDAKIKACLELPDTAFLNPAEASRRFNSTASPLVLISYGWLTDAHPDPDGFHLRTIQQYLKVHKGANASCDAGVFWDYCCVPRKQEGVLAHVEAGVALQLAALYGAPETCVLQLKALPGAKALAIEAAGIPPAIRSNSLAYHLRGWCNFEEAVACLQKTGDGILNLKFAAGALEDGLALEEVHEAAKVEQNPPMHPEDFCIQLDHKEFFKQQDRGSLVDAYLQYFNEVVPHVRELNFRKLIPSSEGWGPSEWLVLGRSLPCFEHCQKLSLAEHGRFDDKTLQDLLPHLSSLRSLQELNFQGCGLTERGLTIIASVVGDLPALNTLMLPSRLKESEQGRDLESTWQAVKGADGLLWVSGPRLQ